jgi:hypothetical protein
MPRPTLPALSPVPQRPRHRTLLVLSAVGLSMIVAIVLTVVVNAVSNRAVPVNATLALSTSRSSRSGLSGPPGGLAPGVAVGTVIGRDGTTLTFVTASGELDQLTLTRATRVAELVDGEPALAVAGSHLFVEGSSIGGILSADYAFLEPGGQPASSSYPSSVPTTPLSIESGIVIRNANGFVTLETAGGQKAVWIGLARITTVVPATTADVRPGSQLLAEGGRGVDGTLAPSVIDLLLTP